MLFFNLLAVLSKVACTKFTLFLARKLNIKFFNYQKLLLDLKKIRVHSMPNGAKLYHFLIGP